MQNFPKIFPNISSLLKRTFQKLRQASIVLWVIDLNTPAEQIEELAKVIIPKAEDKKVILVFNKSDLLSSDELELKQQLLNNIPADRIYISAKQQENTEVLKQHLIQAAALPEVSQNDVIVTNIRLSLIRLKRKALKMNALIIVDDIC